jgi:hypothetical protein
MVERLAMLFRPRRLADAAGRVQPDKLVAVWKLVDCRGEALPPGHPVPHATILFTRRGRFMAMVTESKAGDPAAAAFRAAFPFSGRYRSDAERWTTQVDHTWNDARTSDEQTRRYRFDGERLQVMAGEALFTFEKMK